MTYNPDSPEVTALYTAVFDAERYGQVNPRVIIAELLNEAYERGRLQGIVRYESPGKAINRKLEQKMQGTP
jgi:hypothetical protein